MVPSAGDSAIVNIVGLVCGDQDGDGRVTILDAIIDMQFIVGLIQPTPLQTELSDVVRDGDLNVLDVLLLLQYMVGAAQINGCGPLPNPSP